MEGVRTTSGRRPDASRTSLSQRLKASGRRSDVARTPFDFQKFHVRFKTLEKILSKICSVTILDNSIVVSSTQKYFLQHLYPLREKSGKFARFLRRPDDIRTSSGHLRDCFIFSKISSAFYTHSNNFLKNIF